MWPFKCEHEPTVVTKTYAPPNPVEARRYQYAGPEEQRAIHGVTTVLLKCELCGETWKHELLGKELAETVEAKPVPIVTSCPRCHLVHVDRDEWATRPHRTHLCEACGARWRPCVLPTVGIESTEY